jgi:hypothetical protein
MTNVVFLAHSNPNKTTETDFRSFVACGVCRNKTYRIVHDDDRFPIVECACCNSRIGFVGWVTDDDAKETDTP